MRCQATLRIFSDTSPAAAVTDRLGLQPTAVIEQGAGLGARTTATAEVSVWRLSTEMRQPSELADHLGELLDALEPHRQSLQTLLSDGYEMDCFCFVEAAAVEHAVELDQPLMARLAALPGPLLIDTYGADEGD